MPREPESYRDNIERIKIMFPDKELLKPGYVAKFTGYSVRTLHRKFNMSKGYISVAALARAIS